MSEWNTLEVPACAWCKDQLWGLYIKVYEMESTSMSYDGPYTEGEFRMCFRCLKGKTND